MAEKKITKRERFEEIKALVADKPELVEFLDHEIELLARKTSKSANPTPAQKDALAVAEIVRDILAECEDKRGMTVGAILKDERIASYTKADGNSVSSQMLTAIFTKNAKDFVRTVEKKVAYYALNYGVEDEGEGV
jgi:hypothetical protein